MLKSMTNLIQVSHHNLFFISGVFICQAEIKGSKCKNIQCTEHIIYSITVYLPWLYMHFSKIIYIGRNRSRVIN